MEDAVTFTFLVEKGVIPTEVEIEEMFASDFVSLDIEGQTLELTIKMDGDNYSDIAQLVSRKFADSFPGAKLIG